jgi:magnesium chelatase accessory protein
MSGRLDWRRDGRTWPNREHSRFLRAGGIGWHVQEMGQGPRLLLLHGTAASTHSFRALAPLLARNFSLLIPDLPGHGFTEAPPGGRLSLPVMRDLVQALIEATDFAPEMAAGHSAGAAVLCRLALDTPDVRPKRIVSLNGALLPFGGFAGKIAPGLARALYGNPVAPRVFAFFAGEDSVKRLIGNMGSSIDRDGIRQYKTLMGNPGHVAAALGMMTHWDLDSLAADLPQLPVALTLVTASADRAVPPATATAVRRILPAAEIRHLRGVGHLAHEEKPAMVAELLVELARRDGLLPSTA